jgi:8-oxo-dGTP pyrophosphatase MutT (NUDIX family)
MPAVRLGEKGRGGDVPQAYLCIVDGQVANRRVLVTRKRCVNRFWSGAVSANGTVVNQAGQRALPGGGVHHNETAQQAALREFREESGVNVSGDVAGPLAPPNVATHALTDANGVGFSLVVLVVPAARLDAIRVQAHANVQPHALHPNRPQGGAVRDWEQDGFWAVPKATAVANLGAAVAIPPIHQVAVNNRAAAAAWSQATDWYALMGAEIGNTY